ncbi:hypothetical protein D5086_008362 [Populus alba]|uniref:Uncharacterized protein n=1 Tax=Populus alba TaxID=43335 RepID=A0ACC4CFV1_POPAL
MPLAGDGVAGGVALVLLIAGLLVWFKLSRKRKATPRAYEDGTNLELVDESLDPKEYEAENAKKIIEIALICTQSSPALRPTMSETFVNPKVQASVVANTWVITGTPQTRKLQDILPGIINQLGPDNLDNLRKLAEQFQKEVPSGEAGAAQEDDDDVPELVGGETFETVAEEGQKIPVSDIFNSKSVLTKVVLLVTKETEVR